LAQRVLLKAIRVAAFNFRESEDMVPGLSQLGRIRLRNKGLASDPSITGGT
jgi:hypothetical protein